MGNSKNEPMISHSRRVILSLVFFFSLLCRQQFYVIKWFNEVQNFHDV